MKTKANTVAVVYLPVELDHDAVATFDLLWQALNLVEAVDQPSLRETILPLDTLVVQFGTAMLGGRRALLAEVMDVMGDSGAGFLEALTIVAERPDTTSIKL